MGGSAFPNTKQLLQWEYGAQNRHVGTEFKGLPGSCHLGWMYLMSEQSFRFQKPALAQHARIDAETLVLTWARRYLL